MILNSGSSYLFDTTVFIDAIRARPVARNLLLQVKSDRTISVGYSIITEAELWAGIRGSRTEKEHETLLRPFKRYFINVAVARRAGELQRLLASSKPSTIPSIADCIIAATAEYYGLTVCSKNTRHFSMFSQFSIRVVEYQL
jgi:predicted nucleic acid-binding protein